MPPANKLAAKISFRVQFVLTYRLQDQLAGQKGSAKMGRKVFCLLMLCFWGACPGLSWAAGEIHSGETKAGTISLQNGYQDSLTFDGVQGNGWP